jgi:hypothetical protein
MYHWRCAKFGETFVQDIERLCADEIDEEDRFVEPLNKFKGSFGELPEA